MTKQNDMPDEIYAWPWTLDDQTQHWQITDDGTGVRYVRADKPADNGGEAQAWIESTIAAMDWIDAEDGGPVHFHAEGKYEIRVSKIGAAPHPPEATTCPDGMSCSGNGMDCVGDGLCKGPEVSGEVDLNDINKALLNAADALSLAVSEVRQDTSIRGKADYWTYKDALEAIRRKIEALRPFLPAEK